MGSEILIDIVTLKLYEGRRSNDQTHAPGRRGSSAEHTYVCNATTNDGAPPNQSHFSESIGFGDPKPVGTSDREKPDESATMSKLLENVGGLLKSRPMQIKLRKFDERGSQESFPTQFEVCARHNRWTTSDKLVFQRCAFEKATTQLL